MGDNSTIYALSSGRPPAAISVVRVSGREAHLAAIRIAGRLPKPRLAALRAFRHPSSGMLIDSGLVLRFDGPMSSTGEDVVEFHCHGGRAVVDALLGAISSIDGVREASPGEFTRRAFENGRIDLTEAEGLADLIEAETEAQRTAALVRAEGAIRRQIEAWRAAVLALSAAIERSIDFDEDDASQDASFAESCLSLAVELGEWLSRPLVEPLRVGLKVVIAGPPNTGKSSLLNMIAGEEKAIVADLPGTTRDSIEIPLAIGGIPIVLTDTAGLRYTQDQIEAIGVDRARQLVEVSDVLIWLGEPRGAPPHPRLILVHAKADLKDRAHAPEGSLAVSSVTGLGIARLQSSIAVLARDLLPRADQVVFNRRQAGLVQIAHDALRAAADARELIICAEEVRRARTAFDRVTGRAAVDDLLDVLFSRFCLGK